MERLIMREIKFVIFPHAPIIVNEEKWSVVKNIIANELGIQQHKRDEWWEKWSGFANRQLQYRRSEVTEAMRQRFLGTCGQLFVYPVVCALLTWLSYSSTFVSPCNTSLFGQHAS